LEVEGPGLLANDWDEEVIFPKSILLVGPLHGTLTLFNEVSGEYEYTPDAGYHGEDSFTFIVSDGVLESAEQTVTIKIEKVNHVGAGPSAMVAGDFDGDGKMDVATANHDDDNISVLLGDGEGGFADAVNYAAGDGPVALAAGHFTGDAYLDLAVVNQDDETVSIFLNNGSGEFTWYTTLTVGGLPSAIALGDFNEDGETDLAVTKQDEDEVVLFFGNGDGTFQTSGTVSAGAGPVSIAAGDLDGDEHLDLVIANFDEDTLSIRLGAGDGTFSPPAISEVPVGAGPKAVILGDFNGDTLLDAAVANRRVFACAWAITESCSAWRVIR